MKLDASRWGVYCDQAACLTVLYFIFLHKMFSPIFNGKVSNCLAELVTKWPYKIA